VPSDERKHCDPHEMTVGGECVKCGTPWSNLTVGQMEDAIIRRAPRASVEGSGSEDDMVAAMVREIDHYRDALAHALAVIMQSQCDEGQVDGSDHDAVLARVKRLWPAVVEHPRIAPILALPEGPALAAPAPREAGEPVAWQLVPTRTGQRWRADGSREYVERQQRALALDGITETRIAALGDFAAPAPPAAPEVTVTEDMVERGAYVAFCEEHGARFWDRPDWHDQRDAARDTVRLILTAALRGGAR